MLARKPTELHILANQLDPQTLANIASDVWHDQWNWRAAQRRAINCPWDKPISPRVPRV